MNIHSFWSGDALWEAMDTVPGVSRLPTPGRSLHQVCECSFFPQLLISIFQSFNFSQKLKTPIGTIIAVGTAPFSTGEGKRRRTWLKLGCSLIVGTSESSQCSNNSHVFALPTRLYALRRCCDWPDSARSCDCTMMHDGPGLCRSAVALWVGMSFQVGLLVVPKKSRLVVWLICLPV
jgi:hypothetical protein